MTYRLTRRSVFQGFAAGAAAAVFGLGRDAGAAEVGLKGNIKFGVTQGFGRKMGMELFLPAIKALGIQALDLVRPEDWATVHEAGLAVSMGSGAGLGLGKGFNRTELHTELIADYEEIIPLAAKAGVKNVICFSGNRDGMDDETGMKNCAEGLKKLMGLCEKQGVTLSMELLNSRVNHKGYMCDHTAWGAGLCALIGSEKFKLLYDAYHMQIMEGDLISTIRDNIDCISHFHVAGNPGRNDPDDTQEIYYPAVMRAIVETGYDGYVAFEYSPANRAATNEERIESLRKAIAICDV